ncbi:hypothetical protein DPMN_185164 [Dreissena polymorpha]|uniref:Uncharacterized protein n=2 Tax=Dreissena polymorpha TaxID=45954 RepID=A0A9D4DJZ2_DREPO|nr:hypothetical protein DPMN_185164 [Dreissena polymorpha]
MNCKKRKSHKKQARSNTHWDATAARGTSDFHPYATSTDRGTPLTRGVIVPHPPERSKARSPQSNTNDTELEGQEKRRGVNYHPSGKNTYWDALDARGSRDSHPYSSYLEVRKSQRTIEKHKKTCCDRIYRA